MRTVAYNLMNKLQDLSIWGSCHISNNGFQTICNKATETFKRMIYAGCYKISDDSKQWIADKFLVYTLSDDFGIQIDYD